MWSSHDEKLSAFCQHKFYKRKVCGLEMCLQIPSALARLSMSDMRTFKENSKWLTYNNFLLKIISCMSKGDYQIFNPTKCHTISGSAHFYSLRFLSKLLINYGSQNRAWSLCKINKNTPINIQQCIQYIWGKNIFMYRQFSSRF